MLAGQRPRAVRRSRSPARRRTSTRPIGTRVADAQCGLAAPPLGRRAVGQVWRVRFARVDDRPAARAPQLQQHARRLDDRCEQRHVVAERGAESARLDEVALHVDHDQRGAAGRQLEGERSRVDGERAVRRARPPATAGCGWALMPPALRPSAGSLRSTHADRLLAAGPPGTRGRRPHCRRHDDRWAPARPCGADIVSVGAGRVAAVDDAAFAHHDDPVGHVQQFVEVLADHQHRRAAVACGHQPRDVFRPRP